jgi:hypothetical protein
MCSFWASGISSFPFSPAREYRLLRRLGWNGLKGFVQDCSCGDGFCSSCLDQLAWKHPFDLLAWKHPFIVALRPPSWT